jgi:hypothetical protein
VYVSGDESVKSSKEIAPVKIVNGGLSGACHVFDFQAYAKWMEIDFFFQIFSFWQLQWYRAGHVVLLRGLKEGRN